MFSHSKLVVVFALCSLCLLATPAVAAAPDSAKLSELKTQLDGLSTLDKKLEFLKTAARGLSLETKATLGASLIQSTPEASRKEAARRVAQTLTGLQDGSDAAKLAGLLTGKLPRNMAGSLAGSIAIGAALNDPQHLPQIAAAVIVAQPSTIENAGAIAQEIITAAPLGEASRIASAIGAQFADHRDLVKKAPEIAGGITRGILTQRAPIEQVRPEIAYSIAALAALLPGSVRSNHDLITNIGKAVAEVIYKTHSGVATTVVGITSATLKAAAGSSDISMVLESFRNAFRDIIQDPIIQGKLDQVVTDINEGTSDKSIKPLEKPTEKPGAPVTPPPSFPHEGGGSGWIVPHESNVVNF